MGVLCNCLLGALHEHCVIRSIPLCGVKAFYLAQMIQLDKQPWATAKKKKKKTVPWLSSSRSERHVLQCRCQPTPTQPIQNRSGGGRIRGKASRHQKAGFVLYIKYMHEGVPEVGVTGERNAPSQHSCVASKHAYGITSAENAG